MYCSNFNVYCNVYCTCTVRILYVYCYFIEKLASSPLVHHPLPVSRYLIFTLRRHLMCGETTPKHMRGIRLMEEILHHPEKRGANNNVIHSLNPVPPVLILNEASPSGGAGFPSIESADPWRHPPSQY